MPPSSAGKKEKKQKPSGRSARAVAAWTAFCTKRGLGKVRMPVATQPGIRTVQVKKTTPMRLTKLSIDSDGEVRCPSCRRWFRTGPGVWSCPRCRGEQYQAV